MFSPASLVADLPPRPRAGLRRGGPVLLREVLPSALDQALAGRAPRSGSPDAEQPAAPHWPPRRPPLPHAA